MGRWADVEASEPDFAAAVRQRFDANKHKLLATLRADGSPRISGIETTWRGGDLWLGMMPGSRKLADLRRDPRLELHTSSEEADEADPGSWSGDAKVTGRAIEELDATRRGQILADSATGGFEPSEVPLFRVDIESVVRLTIGTPADHMLVELWRLGQPLQRTKRA